MRDTQDKLPQSGERWRTTDGQRAVTVTALYYAEVKCPSPYNNNPTVIFIRDGGGVSTMALKAFLMTHILSEGDDFFGEEYDDEEYNDDEVIPSSQGDKSPPDDRSSDALKRWQVKDSRRFSHYEK